MSPFIDSVIIVLCGLGLWGGADLVVDSASNIARKLGLSELVVGLTVVAIATSLPEFAVSVSAALTNRPAISVGNIVGSNIFNLGFILGLVTLFGTVKITKEILYRDFTFLIGASLLLVVFFMDMRLSRLEGILLLIALIVYLTKLIKTKKNNDEKKSDIKLKWWIVPKFIIGVGLIIISAQYFVESASAIARMLHVSEWLIGITVVAGGTSLPELATSLMAISKGKQGISIGNLIGSDIFNQLGVLGTASILNPLKITRHDYISVIVMLGALVVTFFLMRRKWKLTKVEGAIILAIALLRWILDPYF